MRADSKDEDLVRLLRMKGFYTGSPSIRPEIPARSCAAAGMTLDMCGKIEAEKPEPSPYILAQKEIAMQTQSAIFDEIAKLMTEAAGAADGVRREAETVMRSRLQSLIADMDLVTRDEFEAVKEMARLAREENESLKARLDALENK